MTCGGKSNTRDEVVYILLSSTGFHRTRTWTAVLVVASVIGCPDKDTSVIGSCGDNASVIGSHGTKTSVVYCFLRAHL